jgi:hypothetical protein
MKRFVLIATAVLLLALGLTVFKYGDRWLTERRRVADFQWKLPPDKLSMLSESLAMEGINAALRANAQDPTNWQAVPTWKDSPEILRRNVVDPNAAGVTLSNRNSGEKLSARVELDPTNHVLNIAISRPK